jgi:hypothetical protein
VKSFIAGAYFGGVGGPGGNAGGNRACRDDDFVGGDLLLGAVGVDNDFAGSVEGGGAIKELDFSGGQKRFDAAPKHGQDFVLALLDFGPVGGDCAGDVDAHVGGVREEARMALEGMQP